MDQRILDWQNSLNSIFGISYAGPKDGKLNQVLINAILELEAKYSVYGQIFTGSGIKMTVAEAEKKFFGNSSGAPSPIKVPPEQNSLKIWESFFSQNLPIVGKIYDGNLATTAKKLETKIGRSIHRSMSGVIWNDEKKQFNTTPDDIKKALELIQAHAQKSTTSAAKFTLDQRVVKMSQMLLEKINNF